MDRRRALAQQPPTADQFVELRALDWGSIVRSRLHADELLRFLRVGGAA